MEAAALIRPFDYALGPWMGAGIVLSWCGHLLLCLRLGPETGAVSVVAHMALQTFLSTGLFITCHDSIHGVVARGRPRLNRAIGAIAIFLYAGFSWERLRAAHELHHLCPVSPQDPDYASDPGEDFFGWLAEFAGRYYGLREFAIMHLHVGVVWLVGGAIWKVFAYFAIPAWLSALQLFYFGTYLPHRTRGAPAHENRHRARSNRMPGWLSLLTCYHFGCHLEHHEVPQAPWWTLPRLRAFNEGLRDPQDPA